MLQEKWSFERVFMEVPMAATAAALRTDPVRFTEWELHAPNEATLYFIRHSLARCSCPATQRPVASAEQVSGDS